MRDASAARKNDNFVRRKGDQLSRGDHFFMVCCYVIATLWLILLLMPLFWLVSSSLKDNFTIYDYPPFRLLPRIVQKLEVRLDYSDQVQRLSSPKLRRLIVRDAALTTWGGLSQFRNTQLTEVEVQAVANGRLLLQSKLSLLHFNTWRGNEFIAERIPDFLIERKAQHLLKLQGFNYYRHPPVISSTYGMTNTELGRKFRSWFAGYPIKGKLTGLGQKGVPWRQFDNYVAAWNGIGYYGKGFGFSRYFCNSIFVTLLSVLAQLIISSMAGFALSALFSQRWSNRLTLFFLGTLMFPEIALLIPLYMTMNDLHLYNSLWAVMLPHMAWGFAVYLFKGFFDQLPRDLYEAARIDGANNLRIFAQVTVPLSKPVFGVIALFTFWAVWPEFMWPLVILRDKAKWTFALALYDMQSSTNVPPNQIMAAAVVATLPTTFIFILFQNMIVKGIAWSGIKG